MTGRQPRGRVEQAPKVREMIGGEEEEEGGVLSTKKRESKGLCRVEKV